MRDFVSRTEVLTSVHGRRVLLQVQLPYYVEAFEPSVMRLAIFQKYEGISMAEMVFNWSLGPLICGALLPPILLSFFIAATNRDDPFLTSLDRFIDLCLYFVMQFSCPPQRFSFYTQIIIAVIMLCIFLVTSILQGEVISFSKKTRIPESGCHFSKCETPMASEVFGYDNDFKPTKSAIFDFYLSENATSPRRAEIAVCHKNKRAMFTASFFGETYEGVFSRTICGKKRTWHRGP